MSSASPFFFKYTKNPPSVSVHTPHSTVNTLIGFLALLAFFSISQFPCEHHCDPHIQYQINPFPSHHNPSSPPSSSSFSFNLRYFHQKFLSLSCPSLFVHFPLNLLYISVSPRIFLPYSFGLYVTKYLLSHSNLLLLSHFIYLFYLLIPDSHSQSVSSTSLTSLHCIHIHIHVIIIYTYGSLILCFTCRTD